MKKDNTHITIKLKKSLIGRLPKHIEIAKLLGLTRINSIVIKANSPEILGMVNVINYLVEVEECVK
jgi:large subunit ribosomal protein L30